MKTEIVASQKELNEWRNRISSAYQKSVASVIEVGRLVKQAKERLGVSYELLVTELPFSASNAAYFVKIAEHPVLRPIPKSIRTITNGFEDNKC